MVILIATTCSYYWSCKLFILCRLPGPNLEAELFLSASIQGQSTFLILGGYKMNNQGSGIGQRSAGILEYDGIKKVWMTDNNATNHMELPRGGHIAIPITYSKELKYLIGEFSFKNNSNMKTNFSINCFYLGQSGEWATVWAQKASNFSKLSHKSCPPRILAN